MSGDGPQPIPDLRTNRLLAALPAAEYGDLRPHLKIVYLHPGDPIYEAGAAMGHVYFPLTGIASVVAAMAEGGIVEVGTVGREGLWGWRRSTAPTAAR